MSPHSADIPVAEDALHSHGDGAHGIGPGPAAGTGGTAGGDLRTLRPHPLRESLHNEIHARPYDRLEAPIVLTHLAWLLDGDSCIREPLCELLRSQHLPVPAADSNQLSVDIGGLHLRWEQHTEFETCTFWRPLTPGHVVSAFERPALRDVPQAWLRALPGQWLVGMHVVVVGGDAVGDGHAETLVREHLLEEHLVGSRVMGCAELHTDLRLHADGCSRFVLQVGDLPARRVGRAVKRLLDAETYRLMALLGLPVAREVATALMHAERDLAAVAAQIRSAKRADDPALLMQLTHLAAEVESLYASTHARFSASAAYFELVHRRIEELKETRLKDLQTLREFMDRRLTPAMQTCAWAARRQQALSERISRTSNLLRTRVDIEQQQGNQALLDAMNRRQRAQLLLQTAVEGLSVAAITYYGAGLVGYVAKGLKDAGVGWIDPEIATALAIPIIAFAVWWSARRLHHIARHELD